MSLLIVGSVALDTVETPHGTARDAIGGSAVYGAYAAALSTKPYIVGVVGEDFPRREVRALQNKGVDTQGLERVEGGSTFKWGGRYFDNMNDRETLFTELNVFSEFQPKLPAAYSRIRNVFLANIDPDLQLDVLSQVREPRLVVCDTMNLWIDIKRKALVRLLKKIDVLLLNDEEACMLADTTSLPAAGAALRRMGIPRVIVKKGEHGCLMFSQAGCFACPALAIPKVKDPTGAGDTFAGGMLGWIASRKLTEANWRKAILVGTAMASFCVEDFSVGRLRRLRQDSLRERVETLREMMSVGRI